MLGGDPSLTVAGLALLYHDLLHPWLGRWPQAERRRATAEGRPCLLKRQRAGSHTHRGLTDGPCISRHAESELEYISYKAEWTEKPFPTSCC